MSFEPTSLHAILAPELDPDTRRELDMLAAMSTPREEARPAPWWRRLLQRRG